MLGKEACLALGLITRVSPAAFTGPTVVATGCKDEATESAGELIGRFVDLFDGKLGRLKRTFHIPMKAHVEPVRHAPRRVPLTLKKQVKEKLEEMEKKGMVVVTKADGDFRVCLDARDLNKFMQRNYYQILNETAFASLAKATSFTVIDADNAYFQLFAISNFSLVDQFSGTWKSTSEAYSSKKIINEFANFGTDFLWYLWS